MNYHNLMLLNARERVERGSGNDRRRTVAAS
jgi:hypothetical protein